MKSIERKKVKLVNKKTDKGIKNEQQIKDRMYNNVKRIRVNRTKRQ